MGSGDTFSVVSIALFMQQAPGYFVWNAFAIIFGLTMLGMILGLCLGSQTSTVFAQIEVLLIMAAYKGTMMNWVPLQGTLNRGDKYLFFNFFVTISLTVFVLFDLLCRDLGYVPDDWLSTPIEASPNATGVDDDASAASSRKSGGTAGGEVFLAPGIVARFGYDRVIFLIMTVFWLPLHLRWAYMMVYGHFWRQEDLVAYEDSCPCTTSSGSSGTSCRSASATRAT